MERHMKLRKAKSSVTEWPPMYIVSKKRILYKCERMASLPEWTDTETVHGSHEAVGRVYASGSITKPKSGRKVALVTTHKPYTCTELPDLPECVHLAGIYCTESHVYVVGGGRKSKKKMCKLQSVYRLCLQTNTWDTCPPLLEAVVLPILLLHQGYLYSLGSDSRHGDMRKVQRYNIATSEWSYIKDLPFVFYTDFSLRRAVVYQDKITVVASDRLTIYQPETNQWTEEKFKYQVSWISPLVIEDKLCATIGDPGNRQRVVYDSDERKWIDHEKDNEWLNNEWLNKF